RCHNSHPESPRAGWKEGDVRGVLEVTRPLGPVVAQTRAALGRTFLLMALLSVLGATGLALVIGKHRRATADLERRVAERTAALSRSNADLEREVAERRQAEHSLAQERNLLRTLMDTLPDHAFVKDTHSRFVTANRATLHTLGAATPAEVVGKTDFDFLPP